MKTGQPKAGIGIVGRIIALGGLAGAIVSIAGCFALFASPIAKLFQAPTPTAPPPQMMGQLSNLKLEFGSDLSNYVSRQNFLRADDYSQAELQEKGVIVHFVAQINGFKGQPCIVGWDVYDATAQKRVSSGGSARYDARYELRITPDADSDRASTFIWIPSPGTVGTFFARLDLFAPNGTRLDYMDSEQFVVK